MTTVKKIILFLFGIILIVFGNKAAIDTIFKSNEGLKVPDSEEKEVTSKKAVITEQVETKEVETIAKNNTTLSPPKADIKTEEVVKKEAPKKITKKVVKEQSPKVEEKEVQQVSEAPKTNIEPIKEETAAASE